MTGGVAVVIPTYNYGRFIGEALHSVFEQSVRPDEVIVVDDGSTDDTEAEVGRFGQVRYIRQDNAGPGAARNLGVQEAASARIVFLDADDRFLPGGLARLVRAWEGFDGAVRAVFGKSQVIPEGASREHVEEAEFPETSDVAPYFETQTTPGTWLLNETFYEALLRQNIVRQGAVIVDREAFMACGGFDRTVISAEDQHLWLRFAGRHRLGFVDATVAFYRKHVNNLTDRSNWIRNRRNILYVLRDVASKDDVPDPLRTAARRQFARTSDLLAQRLMDRGRFAEAAEVLREGLAAEPIQLKSRLRLVLCRIRSLVGGREDRKEPR